MSQKNEKESKTLVVVNGSTAWSDEFSNLHVQQIELNDCRWVKRDEKIVVVTKAGPIYPDCIFWRLGAVRPKAEHETALKMIASSTTPCVNSAESLLLGYDRLSMLKTLRDADIQVIEFDTVSDGSQLKSIERPFPFVVKVGNFHGGYGKVLVSDREGWRELLELLYVVETYVTTERYIPYQRDIRILAVGDHTWAMSRRGEGWKVNSGVAQVEPIAMTNQWKEKISNLQSVAGSEIVAIDVLEDIDGTQVAVEYNDVPGFSGFPRATIDAAMALVRARL